MTPGSAPEPRPLGPVLWGIRKFGTRWMWQGADEAVMAFESPGQAESWGEDHYDIDCRWEVVPLFVMRPSEPVGAPPREPGEAVEPGHSQSGWATTPSAGTSRDPSNPAYAVHECRAGGKAHYHVTANDEFDLIGGRFETREEADRCAARLNANPADHDALCGTDAYRPSDALPPSSPQSEPTEAVEGGTWWCCAANYPDHEVGCRNFTQSESRRERGEA